MSLFNSCRIYASFLPTISKSVQVFTLKPVLNPYRPSARLLNVKISRHASTERHDNVQNVYYGVLTPQIRAVKIFSIATSLSGVLAQPIIYSHANDIGSVSVMIGLCTFVGFFTFVTPFLLHSITKKYVTHLDYDASRDEYVATIVTFFLKRKKIPFKVDDVVVPDLPGMFTSMTVRGTPLFVDPSLFADPAHYARIMGYDRPIDFKLKDGGSKDVS